MNTPTPDTSAGHASEFRPVLERLGGTRPETPARAGADYKRLRNRASEIIEEAPEMVATVIEFQFSNPTATSEAVQLESITLLFELGARPEYRGRATELLGMAEQSDSAVVRRAAVKAVNGLSRRRLGDGKRRGEQPDGD